MSNGGPRQANLGAMAAPNARRHHAGQGSQGCGPWSADMGMLTRWGGWFCRPATRQAGHTLVAASEACDVLPQEPERPWGCGWFDSSLDLQQGLAVFEHDGADLALAVRQMLQPERALH
jgi:hypothetical protein